MGCVAIWSGSYDKSCSCVYKGQNGSLQHMTRPGGPAPQPARHPLIAAAKPIPKAS
jgi:hypothetical protein